MPIAVSRCSTRLSCGLLGERGELGDASVEVDPAQLRHRGHHHPLAGLGLVGRGRRTARPARLLSTRDFAWLTRTVERTSTGTSKRSESSNASRVKSSASCESLGSSIGHPCERGVVVGVLLVLRGVHAGIVGDQDHQPAANAGVGQREERIGGDVEADVLHRDQCAPADQRYSGGDLEGDLLVGRPFGVHAGELREPLERLGRRRAGIAHADDRAGLPSALCNGLITRQQTYGSRASSHWRRRAA